MIYYVIYETGIGLNMYSEEDLKYITISDNCVIEFYGSKKECQEYMNYNY